MATIETERRKYIRTGRVDWVRFIPWLFLIIFVAIALAFGLDWLYRGGFYYVVIFPAMLGLGMGGLVYLAVQFGHCRSRLVAALTGLLAGTLLYLGYYHAGLIHEIGPQGISHVELLPDYIKFRMNSDVISDVNHDPAVGHKNSSAPKKDGDDSDETEPVRSSTSGKSIENWLTFAFEFVIILGASVAFGYLRSKRAFCERCRKWMTQEISVCLPDIGPGLLSAFNAGQFSTITGARVVPIVKNTPYTAVAIDYCGAPSGQTTQCPVYFSIKEIRASSAGQAGQFDGPRGTSYLDRVELTPAEALQLAPRFRILTSLLGVAPVPAPPFSAAPASGTSGLSMVTPVASAQVATVPPAAEGRVLSRKNTIIGNLLSLSMLIFFFGGMGAFLGGLFLLIPDDSTPPIPHSTLRIISGIVLIICGIPVAIVGAITCLRNPSRLGNRRLLALCRRNFKRRSGSLFDLGDPDLLFVEVVPRKNWGRLMLDTAEDIGFLRIEPQKREILFEGDCERIRIPADAIISCTVQEVTTGNPQQPGSIRHQMIVIEAHRDASAWEMCFTQRWVDWSVNNEKRWTRANEIRQRIVALNPAAAR